MAELPRGFRLLVVVTGLGLGGTERHLAAVLPALVARGASVRVVSLRGRGEMAARLEADGVEVRDASGSVSGFTAVLREALAWRPDVSHFFLPEATIIGGLACWLSGRRPRAASRRSLNTYQLAHPRAARMERWLHGRMDALIGNSRAVCEELLAEGAPAERVALLPNGVITAPPSRPRAELRTALGIPEGAIAILCVANLIPYKGHADLIEAFAKARPHLPPGSMLLCAGRDDGYGVALTAQAEALAVIDQVKLVGQRDDVADLLGAADVFALASHEEGSPNAVIEAMAAGLPTIVTDVGGSPEAVAEAGLVVPPREPSALADALVRLGNDHDLREALGAAAAERAQARYGLESCVAHYVSLYAALTSGRAPASVLPMSA
ncbi:glycosyltransferase [Elioraea rosea]|uniref:glycosyltransferase n=1 Tax=Elioraea rosea TaxID=2492390 RepID=UPI0013155EB9|nr:glycosyltransferase [Elioraea rosea]